MQGFFIIKYKERDDVKLIKKIMPNHATSVKPNNATIASVQSEARKTTQMQN